MKLGRFWSWFWSFAGSVSIRLKIMGIVLVLILILGLGVTFQIRSSLAETLTDELEKHGVSIARDLAARSTDLILTNNDFDLYQLLRSVAESKEDVRYAFIVGPDGNVLSHTFSSGFPAGLAEVNPVEPEAPSKLEILDTDEGLIWDVALPILGGRVGTARVGMSSRNLLETVAATTWRLLLYTGIVSLIGLLAAYSLTSVLTRPIVHLVEVTKAIARGELKRKAPVWAPDEIGRLGIAFNSMTESLAKSRGKSEAFEKELLRRNQELSALNAIAAEVSGPQGFTEMMHGSLAKVLEAVGLNAGWVSMLTEDRKRATLVCQEGLSPETEQRMAAVNLSSCACRTVVSKKSPLVIQDNSTTCAILRHKLDNGQLVRCHATAPLISKSRVFGLLHVASSEPSRFTAEDLELLNSIGHQMGVAVENARLWEELKRNEEVRGQLLKQTISAQEAERKRIARELHDQTGQSLTSLMVGLKVLEAHSSEKERKGIADLKQLTAQTLEEVHNLALELRPSSIDDLGIITALQQYAKEYSSKFGIEADFQAIGLDGKRLSPPIEIALYRIIQEALTNVAKHSEAKKVSVLMEVRGASIVAIVEDDGQGFDVQKVLTSRMSERKLGLYGMRERASLIDGVLTIESSPGMGTTIFVEVPLVGERVK
jgi:signal transduction histidine kinase